MTEQDLRSVAFPRFDASQLAKLPRCTEAKRERHERGRRLVQTGDKDYKFFVVVSGEVEVLDESSDLPKSSARTLDHDMSVYLARELAQSPHWTKKRQPFLLETSRPGFFAAGDVRSDSVKRILGGWRGTHGGEVRARVPQGNVNQFAGAGGRSSRSRISQ